MSSEKNNDLEKAFELIQESISLARKDNLHFGFDFKEKSMDLMKALYYSDIIDYNNSWDSSSSSCYEDSWDSSSSCSY